MCFLGLVGLGSLRKSVLWIPNTASSSSWLQEVWVCVVIGICITGGVNPSLGVEVFCAVVECMSGE